MLGAGYQSAFDQGWRDEGAGCVVHEHAAVGLEQPHLIGQTSADNVARYFDKQKLPLQTFIPVVPVKGPQEAKAVYKQLGYGELQ